MTLQTSPVLSTPHFILLHAGCFTVLVQRQRLETTGKTVALAFPGKNPITVEKKHVPTVTLSVDRWKYSRDIYSETGVYLTSSTRISSGVWCQPGLLVIRLYVCCPPSCLPVCLLVTEHLIAAVMYPHYVPIPWPSHLASMALSGGNWVLGLPRLSFSLSQHPFHSILSHFHSELLSCPGDRRSYKNGNRGHDTNLFQRFKSP